jgi:hypothetical protein
MRTVLLGVVLFIAGCTAVREARRPLFTGRLLASMAPKLAARKPVHVVLVTVDGVRPRDVFEGVDEALARRFKLPDDEVRPAREIMPTIYRRVIDRGVALGLPGLGAPVVASGPNFVSLPGYREIMTGRGRGDCTQNVCPPLEEPTLLDELLESASNPEEVAVVASWDTYARAVTRDPTGLAVSAGRKQGLTREKLRVAPAVSQALDDGAGADPWPGHGAYRPDAYTMQVALAYLEARRPRLLVVGLGDTDEHAHRGDYRGYLGALTRVDAFVGRVLDLLERFEEDGAETWLILTTDHGRSASFKGHGRWAPESRHVWLLARGPRVPARGLVAPSGERRLCDVAPTLRLVFGLPADPSPRAGQPIPELLPELVAAAAAR